MNIIKSVLALGVVAAGLATPAFAQTALDQIKSAGALRVGTEVTLQDVSARFDNAYSVVACTHRYDMRRGYETSFVAEGAYLGQAA